MVRILSEIHYAEVGGGLEYSYSNGVLQGSINRINKIISFLSVTSLFAGINGFFKTYIGYVILGLDPVFNICFVAFLVAFGVYSLDKALDMDKDATNLPGRLKFLRGRKNWVIGCSLGAYVIAMAMAFMDKPLGLIIVLIPIITYFTERRNPSALDLFVDGEWILATALLGALYKTGMMVH